MCNLSCFKLTINICCWWHFLCHPSGVFLEMVDFLPLGFDILPHKISPLCLIWQYSGWKTKIVQSLEKAPHWVIVCLWCVELIVLLYSDSNLLAGDFSFYLLFLVLLLFLYFMFRRQKWFVVLDFFSGVLLLIVFFVLFCHWKNNWFRFHNLNFMPFLWRLN